MAPEIKIGHDTLMRKCKSFKAVVVVELINRPEYKKVGNIFVVTD